MIVRAPGWVWARQEADCRERAGRLGWTVAGLYVDNDLSAYSGKLRPEYQRMLEDPRLGSVDAVIAWHTDRLHRSPRELEALPDNKSHYVRDTTWREDGHQSWVGNGPHTMATLRNLALGLFRLNNIHKIKETTEAIRRDRTRALPLLAT